MDVGVVCILSPSVRSTSFCRACSSSLPAIENAAFPHRPPLLPAFRARRPSPMEVLDRALRAHLGSKFERHADRFLRADEQRRDFPSSALARRSPEIQARLRDAQQMSAPDDTPAATAGAGVPDTLRRRPISHGDDSTPATPDGVEPGQKQSNENKDGDGPIGKTPDGQCASTSFPSLAPR